MHNALILVSIMSACLYGLLLTVRPQSLLRTLVKMAAIGALTVLCLFANTPLFLLLALTFGTLGDGFLSRDGDRFFLAGLAAFLIGHVCYILLFLQWPTELAILLENPLRIAIAVALLAASIVVAWQLTPHLGDLRLPVYAYITVSLVLGLSALVLPGLGSVTMVTIGALLFIASDIILAYDLFVISKASSLRKLTSRVLWFLYWGGQLLILQGVIQAAP